MPPDDFAALVLLDERYAHPRISSRLPSWILSELAVQSSVSTPRPFQDTSSCKRVCSSHKRKSRCSLSSDRSTAKARIYIPLFSSWLELKRVRTSILDNHGFATKSVAMKQEQSLSRMDSTRKGCKRLDRARQFEATWHGQTCATHLASHATSHEPQGDGSMVWLAKVPKEAPKLVECDSSIEILYVQHVPWQPAKTSTHQSKRKFNTANH
jgi:hypothetical protein